jgi:hypothetical protein
MHAILAFCSAVIAFPFPLALPFGEVFDSDDGAMAAGALVGLSGCNFFGKLDFNKFLIDCALMFSLSSSKFLQPIPKMIKIIEWRLRIASLDLIDGPFQLANLPHLMKEPLTHHALRWPIFPRHTIQSAKDTI